MCFHQNSREPSLEVKPLYKHFVHIVDSNKFADEEKYNKLETA